MGLQYRFLQRKYFYLGETLTIWQTMGKFSTYLRILSNSPNIKLVLKIVSEQQPQLYKIRRYIYSIYASHFHQISNRKVY
jgi:hypothetical protein